MASMIDHESDRIRFYNLGNAYEGRIESMGPHEPEYYENPIVL